MKLFISILVNLCLLNLQTVLCVTVDLRSDDFSSGVEKIFNAAFSNGELSAHPTCLLHCLSNIEKLVDDFYQKLQVKSLMESFLGDYDEVDDAGDDLCPLKGMGDVCNMLYIKIAGNRTDVSKSRTRTESSISSIPNPKVLSEGVKERSSSTYRNFQHAFNRQPKTASSSNRNYQQDDRRRSQVIDKNYQQSGYREPLKSSSSISHSFDYREPFESFSSVERYFQQADYDKPSVISPSVDKSFLQAGYPGSSETSSSIDRNFKPADRQQPKTSYSVYSNYQRPDYRRQPESSWSVYSNYQQPFYRQPQETPFNSRFQQTGYRQQDPSPVYAKQAGSRQPSETLSSSSSSSFDRNFQEADYRSQLESLLDRNFRQQLQQDGYRQPPENQFSSNTNFRGYRRQPSRTRSSINSDFRRAVYRQPDISSSDFQSASHEQRPTFHSSLLNGYRQPQRTTFEPSTMVAVSSGQNDRKSAISRKPLTPTNISSSTTNTSVPPRNRWKSLSKRLPLTDGKNKRQQEAKSIIEELLKVPTFMDIVRSLPAGKKFVINPVFPKYYDDHFELYISPIRRSNVSNAVRHRSVHPERRPNESINTSNAIPSCRPDGRDDADINCTAQGYYQQVSSKSTAGCQPNPINNAATDNEYGEAENNQTDSLTSTIPYAPPLPTVTAKPLRTASQNALNPLRPIFLTDELIRKLLREYDENRNLASG